MEQEIQRRVLTITKQNQDRMAEETGIQSSLTDEDVKDYLGQVVEEVKGINTTLLTSHTNIRRKKPMTKEEEL